MTISEKLKAILPYGVVLAIAVYLYRVAEHFNFTPTEGRLGPDFWPKLVLILMIAVCAYEIVKTLLFGQREVEGVLESVIEEVEGEKELEKPAGTGQKTYPGLLVGGVALTLVYVLLFDILGFFLDTLLYVALFIYLGRYRRIGVILVTSLVTSLAFMFVFMKIVYVSLPIGVKPFSEVSLFLMSLMGIH